MRTMLFSFATLTMLLAFPALALAQVDGTKPLSHPPGSYARGTFYVTTDGTLVIGEDVLLDCADTAYSEDDFLGMTQEGKAGAKQSARVNEDVCAEAGFPPSDEVAARQGVFTEEPPADEGDAPSYPQYKVNETGTLSISDGAYVTEYCRLLVEEPKEVMVKNAATIAACEAAGFVSTEATPLSKTGGPPVVLLGVAALAVFGGGLLRRVGR